PSTATVLSRRPSLVNRPSGSRYLGRGCERDSQGPVEETRPRPWQRPGGGLRLGSGPSDLQQAEEHHEQDDNRQHPRYRTEFALAGIGVSAGRRLGGRSVGSSVARRLGETQEPADLRKAGLEPT